MRQTTETIMGRKKGWKNVLSVLSRDFALSVTADGFYSAGVVRLHTTGSSEGIHVCSYCTVQGALSFPAGSL